MITGGRAGPFGVRSEGVGERLSHPASGLADAPVAELVRNGFVESVHRGRVVALDARGAVVLTVGDPDAPVLPRSSAKPLQAVAMLRLGLDLDGELLALAAASHAGEPFHLDGVRRILAGAGLDERHLQTPPDWPLDEQAKLDLARAGGGPSALAMNCSGKHAAMLATCVRNGWELDGYLDPQHQLQRSIAGTVEELTGAPLTHHAVDGCGAPLLGTTLTGLAQAFRRLATAPAGSAERRVVEAVQAHPAWTSGTHRDEAQLIGGVPGLVAKAGAEGVHAAALDDGRAVALKIADGAQRATPVVMVAALRHLGVRAPVLDELGTTAVLGGGVPVGLLRPLLG